jgi:hypothetical protein
VRGKFIAKLQLSYREKQMMERNHKADNDAWDELMKDTVAELQNELAKGLQNAIAKIHVLEGNLASERKANQLLQQQLQELKK